MRECSFKMLLNILLFKDMLKKMNINWEESTDEIILI